MTEISIVRENLMTIPHYTGFCGNQLPRNTKGGCSNPRTSWNKHLEQFKCSECGWVSQYPKEFIDRYKLKWNK